MSGEWTIVKDAAGFAGAVCLFAPWVRDYSARVRLSRIEKIPTRLHLKTQLAHHRRSWLSSPKRYDLIISLTGMGLITASFGISLLISLSLLSE